MQTGGVMRYISVYLLLVVPALLFAKEESITMDDVYKLSPYIYDVKGMGNWQVGSRSGQIRLVITRTNKQDEMFLQWVQWNEKGPELIKSTVALKEIQKAGRFKVDYIRRETISGRRQIVLGLENLYDKSASRAIIHVQGIGLYQLKME